MITIMILFYSKHPDDKNSLVLIKSIRALPGSKFIRFVNVNDPQTRVLCAIFQISETPSLWIPKTLFVGRQAIAWVSREIRKRQAELERLKSQFLTQSHDLSRQLLPELMVPIWEYIEPLINWKE